MIENQKHLFDIPGGVTFLDCASRSPLLGPVVAAGEKGLRRKVHPWTYTLADIAPEADRARALFAGLIGAGAADVAIVPAASYGIATAAANLPVAAGQGIVVLEGQFPSNVYSWRRLAARRDARLLTVARPPDHDWTPAVLAAIGADTAVAALPICHWTDGSLLDMAAIADRCRDTDTALVVDATQSAGAMPIDVARLRPDFLVASAYKWLLGPYTMAFLYAAPHRQQGDPLELHAWNHVDPLGQFASGVYADTYAGGAARYDMGQHNNLINLPMMVAALEQVATWGPDAIAGTLRPLTTAAAGLAAARGWSVPARRVDHIVGVHVPGGLPGDIWARLRDAGIHVSVRAGVLRASPYLYNDADDIGRLFATLDRLLAG